MNSNVEFLKLMQMARNHMEENGYSYTSVTCYMRTWRSVYNFGLSKGITQYSAELAEQYMLEKYHMSIGENEVDGTALKPYMAQKIRAIRALTDFKLHGFVPKITRGEMEVWRDKSGEIYYTYSRTSDESYRDGPTILRRQDVLHIPGLGFDGLLGYSPIAMAKNAVGMTIACEEYGASFFANGANPGGVLEHPGVLKDPKKVRDSWNDVYRGSNNAHKVAVLEEGMKYQQIGIPPEEAQFLETRKFQINEIARLYRIPPHMVGDLEKSSFSNIEQQSLEFVKYTLDPWVIRWEQALQRSLFLPKEKTEYFIKLNVDGLLRGDYQSRMNGYAIGRQNGWLSSNDIRLLEDLNPIPDVEGGNLYLINGNMTKLKDAGAFAQTASPNQEEGSDALET